MAKTFLYIPSITLAALLVLPALSLPPPAAKKDKEKRYALLSGTVFTEQGFSLPGVRITIKRKGEGKSKWRAVSDRRGEFAVRLPPGRGTYEVTTHSKQHQSQTKTVELYGEERVDIIFRLPRKTEQRRKD